MEPRQESTLHWGATRIGQVALFWGVLQIALDLLDALIKWDLILTVQLSLEPEFRFVVEPWFAVPLAVLGLGAVWWGSHPMMLAEGRSLAQALPDVNSVKRAVGIPLFLAFVCGLAFGGVEWNSRKHRQLAADTTRGSNPVLSGAVHHRPHGAKRARGVVPPPEQPAADQGTDLNARLSPLLTSAFGRDSGSPDSAEADAGPLAGNLPDDPRPALRAYAYNGARKILLSGQPASDTDTPEHRLFGRIERAHQDRNWSLLASLSEDAIKQSPQWLTPYLFAGEAYANLGKLDRALPMLEYVKQSGSGNPDYDYAFRHATELRESIKQRYGR
ncbi:MAG TPA: hypothetical protein VG204_11625 [Terriglobia bacterium]|nr:hypothetical protein [Terriglobia bacterium]